MIDWKPGMQAVIDIHAAGPLIAATLMHPEAHGKIVTILSCPHPIKDNPFRPPQLLMGCDVEPFLLSSGQVNSVETVFLKPLPDDDDQEEELSKEDLNKPVSWDDVPGWNPTKVKESA